MVKKNSEISVVYEVGQMSQGQIFPGQMLPAQMPLWQLHLIGNIFLKSL